MNTYIWLVFPPDYPAAASVMVEAPDADAAIAKAGAGAGSTASRITAQDVDELHRLIHGLAAQVRDLRPMAQPRGSLQALEAGSTCWSWKPLGGGAPVRPRVLTARLAGCEEVGLYDGEGRLVMWADAAEGRTAPTEAEALERWREAVCEYVKSRRAADENLISNAFHGHPGVPAWAESVTATISRLEAERDASDRKLLEVATELREVLESRSLSRRRLAEMHVERDALRARLAEMEEAQRWVKVTERLPALGEEVLVWTPGWTAATLGYLTEPRDMFVSTDEVDMPGATHWRPLPAGPAGAASAADFCPACGGYEGACDVCAEADR